MAGAYYTCREGILFGLFLKKLTASGCFTLSGFRFEAARIQDFPPFTKAAPTDLYILQVVM